MKTIEDRAQEYAFKKAADIDINLDPIYNKCFTGICEKSYKDGASEQRRIDLIIFHEWMDKNLTYWRGFGRQEAFKSINKMLGWEEDWLYEQ